MAIWLVLSLAFFTTFRLFGGKGKFGDTISISLQLLASIYVIASMVSLIATVLFFADDGDFLNSYLVYLFTQVLLLVIYLPLGLRELHFPSKKFKLGLVLAITFSIILFLFLVVSIFLTTQILPNRVIR